MKTLKNEINDFIIANHSTMTTIEIAKKFGEKANCVTSRKCYLKKKGLLSNVVKNVSKLGNAYVGATLSVTDKKQIQEYIIANHKTMDNFVIASKLGLPVSCIRANFSTLKRFGKLTTTIKKAKVTKEVVDGNNFGNAKGINKGKARAVMTGYIADSDVVGAIPTLPNEDWTIESMIHAINPNNTFIGAEMNAKTFKVMKSTLKRIKGKDETFKASTHKGKIGDVIFGKSNDTYAHMILDYCCGLAMATKEIEYTINNDVLKVGGFMAVTYGKPNRSDNSEGQKLNSLVPKNNSDDRCDGNKMSEAYFQKVTKNTHRVVEFFYYQDTYPMTLVIIQRIK